MTDKIKKCPKCGKTFTCNHSAECWCSKFEISPEKSKEMQKKFNNCLCENCIQEYGTLKKD